MRSSTQRKSLARPAGVLALLSGFGFVGFSGLACLGCLVPLVSAWGVGALAEHWAALPTAAGLGFAAVATTVWFFVMRRRERRTGAACGPECATPVGVTDKPVACDLNVFTPSEREEHGSQFLQRVLGKARRRVELSDGLALEYASDPDFFVQLAQWTVNERRCCPFFTFELALEPDGGALWLKLRGPQGTRELLLAGIASLPPPFASSVAPSGA